MTTCRLYLYNETRLIVQRRERRVFFRRTFKVVACLMVCALVVGYWHGLVA